MINVGHLILRAFKQRTLDNISKFYKPVENIITERFRKVNLTPIFPFYNQVKQGLDAWGGEYELTLNYEIKSIAINDVNTFLHYCHNKKKHHFSYPLYDIVNSINLNGTFTNSFIFYNPILQITLHYPEVKIENENKEFLNLRNFFVRFNISLDGNVSELTGNKTTYTTAEYDKRYIHSHLHTLSTNYKLKFDNFCLGTGQPISFAKIMLEEVIKSKQGINDAINYYCQNINVVVNTESLAGTPYIRLSGVSNNYVDFNSSDVSVLCSSVFDYLSKMDLSKIKSDLFKIGAVRVVNKDVKLTDKADVVLFIDPVLYDFDKVKSILNISKFISVKYNGVDVKLYEVSSATSIVEPIFIRFNGKKFYFTIDNPAIYSPEKLQITFSQPFKKYVRQFIKTLYLSAAIVERETIKESTIAFPEP
jgi:hypothetical protein